MRATGGSFRISAAGMHRDMRLDFTLHPEVPCDHGIDVYADFALPGGAYVDFFELKVRSVS